MTDTVYRLRRVLIVIGSLALVWVIVLSLTGGGIVSIGEIRISTRNPRHPALAALVLALLAWLLGPSGGRTRAWLDEWRWVSQILARIVPVVPAALRRAQTIAAIAAIGVTMVGLIEGSGVVAASDSYGYVSQAHLWATGPLRREPPLMRELTPHISLEALTPLGYRPAADRTTIAPSYSPGLPMVMAVFERLAGPASVFWVVPLLAGVLVWATYAIGARAAGPVAGALAAVLVASSPPCLLQLTTVPMSDLPAASWWTVTMALVLRRDRSAALAAGAAAGLAILTRPNLIPLVVIPGGILMWRLVLEWRLFGKTLQSLLLFSVGVATALVTIGFVNDDLWGSPFLSGYGRLRDIYATSNIWTNLWLYPREIVTLMPMAILAAVGPFILWRRGPLDRVDESRIIAAALSGFIVVGVGCYLAYPAFDASWNLRFLLPVVPAMMVLASVTAVSLAGRSTRTYAPLCVAAITLVVAYGVESARSLGAFRTLPERRFAEAGEYVARQLPERAVLLARLHSGSATYYSGRPTIRFDVIPPSQLDWLIAELQRLGYVPYILLDEGEKEKRDFRLRFEGQSRWSALDWPPHRTLHEGLVEIYALQNRGDPPEAPVPASRR